MAERNRQVLGFMFDRTLGHVLLIRKARPDWQRGRLNGVGGKVEPSDVFSCEDLQCCRSPASAMSPTGARHAMVREFREETGIETCGADWSRRMTFDCGTGAARWECAVFMAIGDIWSRQKMTDEAPEIHLRGLSSANELVLPNLRWIIPALLDPDAPYLTALYPGVHG